MTAIASRPGWKWRAAAGPILGAGLLLLVSACTETYREVCVRAGKPVGTAEYEACVQAQIDTARADRTRNLKYGRGGAGG